MNENLNQFNEIARKKLVELFSQYLETPYDKNVQRAGVDIHREYGNAIGSLLDDSNAEGVTESIEAGLGRLSPERAKEILEELRQRE